MYAEKYLREVWPAVTRSLKEHGIACELNLVEGSMSVRTTRKTWDPYIIIKARWVGAGPVWNGFGQARSVLSAGEQVQSVR